MILVPPCATRTDTLVPYTTRFRSVVAIVVRGMDRCIDRHPVTVADILCESTNQVAALAGVQLGRQSQLILPRYLGVLTLLRCLGRVPQRRSVLRPLRAFRHDDERILNPDRKSTRLNSSH